MATKRQTIQIAIGLAMITPMCISVLQYLAKAAVCLVEDLEREAYVIIDHIRFIMAQPLTERDFIGIYMVMGIIGVAIILITTMGIEDSKQTSEKKQ